MGMYLNPGNGMFQISLNSEIYVDKTGLIGLTNRVVRTSGRYVCVSRPRRFGKTMAMDMLCAYYCRTCDSRAQFEGLRIAGEPTFNDHLNKYDVIKVTMTNELTEGGGTVEGLIKRVETRVMRELAHEYPDIAAYDDDSLPDRLGAVWSATGVPFVFLVDEWDVVMREMQGDDAQQKRYLDWLRNLLKDREYVALAYATGILPVKKYGQHSALNMFSEITILDPAEYAEFTGFSESEVQGLCERYGMDFHECCRWYDGYDIGGQSAFNPRSVVQSCLNGAFGSYWTRTETFEALRRYIALDLDGLRERVARLVAGDELPVETATFQNDMTTLGSADDVLTLLVHLGYLTYDSATGKVRIPNSEVAEEFAVSVRADGGWDDIVAAIAESGELLEATLAGDAARVAELVGRAHRNNASVLRYNDENSLACVLSIAYYAARRDYRIEREAPAGKGFADLVFWPRPGRSCPAIIVELKAGGTAAQAIAQVRSRDYASVLEDYSGALIVGLAYDPNSCSDDYKEHECLIEHG